MKGHIHILEWAIQNKFSLSQNFADHAAHYGQIKVLQWFHDNNYGINVRQNFCRIDVLQWLHNNNYNINVMLCTVGG